MAKHITVEGTWNGVAFTASGSFSPGTPDVRYLPNGDPGYPGDPAEFDAEVSFEVEEPEEFVAFLNTYKADWHESVIDSCFDKAVEAFRNACDDSRDGYEEE